MNRDKGMYVDHIIEANTKFLDLLQKMAGEKISLDDKLLRCRERTQKLAIQRDLQKNRHEKSAKSYKDMDEKMRLQVKE